MPVTQKSNWCQILAQHTTSGHLLTDQVSSKKNKGNRTSGRLSIPTVYWVKTLITYTLQAKHATEKSDITGELY